MSDDAAGAEVLLAREGFPRGLVRELHERGRCEVGEGRWLRLEDLHEVPSTSDWRTELDRLALLEQDTLRRYRVGKLYQVVGEDERAALAWRMVLGPCSLSLALELAEACALAGARGLALACVDRVADDLLRPRDPNEPDPVRRSPEAVAELLERAREAALLAHSPERAAALGRTAAAAFERMNLRSETLRALLGAVRALRAADQIPLALGLSKRARTLAQRSDEPVSEAAALAEVSAAMLAEGEPKRSQALAKQAVELLEEAGEWVAAAPLRRAVAQQLARAGRLDAARKGLTELGARLREDGHVRVALELLEDELEVALLQGRAGDVLQLGESLRKGWEAEGEGQRSAAAMVSLASGLTLAGDLERASKALGRALVDVDDSFVAGRSLVLRAEWAQVAGRPEDARHLLVDAAREFGRALSLGTSDPDVAEEARNRCWLRRAEFAADAKDATGAEADLERISGESLGPLELRVELVRARLSDDPDEREILIDEVYERALSEGTLADRVQAASAKAQGQLAQGLSSEVQDTLRPVLQQLVELRNELPQALRKGLRSSPLARPVMLLADELASNEDAP